MDEKAKTTIAKMEKVIEVTVERKIALEADASIARQLLTEMLTKMNPEDTRNLKEEVERFLASPLGGVA